MKPFIPKRSGNKDYNGLRVSDKYLLFSNEAKQDLGKFNRIDILIDAKAGRIEIKEGRAFPMPKSEKLVTNLTEAGMEKGRYYKVKDFIYEYNA